MSMKSFFELNILNLIAINVLAITKPDMNSAVCRV